MSYGNERDKRLAQQRTAVAQQELDSLPRILVDALKANPMIDWNALKDRRPFDQTAPTQPVCQELPSEPRRSDPRFQAPLTLLEKYMPSLRTKKQQQSDRVFESAHNEWKRTVETLEQSNEQLLSEHQEQLSAWEQQRRLFHERQRTQHAEIDAKKAVYLSKAPAAILEYCTHVIKKSAYPNCFPTSHVLDYLADSGTLIVERQLPSLSDFPTTKEIKFIASRNEFRTVAVSEPWLRRTYDNVLFEIALRTLWELFASDSADAIASIVFNGWVEAVDKATGKDFIAYVLSVQASKGEFLDINLAQVDPRSCFKKLKGISGAKLADVIPVRPILRTNREDKRFVEGYAVVDTLDTGTNLAAMDWLDFENLIRELFEKEFSKNGGEVKITQASRDGGVDAIAFDPDPIRGGKIVIQAKRYTNTVSVAAVRDLYGTIVNEGANKGILVTTADYGRDAYEFAKDKPITLLSGSELLHLLAQHGHRARIDLVVARELEREANRASNKPRPGME
jgi:restriction system protein